MSDLELLADAEGGEDEAEHVFGGGGAGEGVEAAEGFVEVEQQHLVRDAGRDGGACRFEAAQGLLDGLVLADVGQHGEFAQAAAFSGDGLDDGGAELRDALAGDGRGADGSRLQRWDGDGGHEVGLVGGDDEVAARGGEDGGVFVGGCGGGVEDEKHQVGFRHGFARLGDADALGLVAGFAEPGGVDQLDRDAVDGDALGDEVAGGAGRCGDDGSVALDQPVEEAGFSGVGAADDGEPEAVADDAADGEAALQLLERRADLGDAGRDRGGGHDVDVVFGEVDAGLEGGDQRDELGFDRRDLAGERAAHLPRGQPGLLEGGGLDEVADGFGLGEVEAAAEEGALGELAGLGEAGTGGAAGADGVLEQHRRAVHGDLNDVLAGVAVGRGEKGGDDLVEDAVVGEVEQLAEAGAARGELMPEPEHGLGDGTGGGTAEPDDADASAPGWGGDGDDGVAEFVNFVVDFVLRHGFEQDTCGPPWRRPDPLPPPPESPSG